MSNPNLEDTENSKSGKSENQFSVDYIPPKEGFFKKMMVNVFGKTFQNQYIRDGYTFLQQDDYKQAILAFQTAIKDDDANYQGYIGLGEVLIRKGGINNAKNAINYLNEAIKRNPYEYEIYLQIAKIYDKLGRPKDAANERRKLQTVKTLKGNPTNAVANNNMGIILLQQKSYVKAVEYFSKAIKFDPEYEVAQVNQAKAIYHIASKEKNEQKREKYLSRCIQLTEKILKKHENAEVAVVAARAYILLDECDRAMELCDLAYQLEPSLKEVFSTKQIINEKQAKISEASLNYEGYKSLEAEEKKYKKE
ncbi:MAG: Tfp pilus assembly protein PilF [bacterium]|jgi:Tfp pilus assembly protein PilF